MRKQAAFWFAMLPLVAIGQEVVFSHPGGFYQNSFELKLCPSESISEGTYIYYTTDGSAPTSHSQRYTSPLLLDKRMCSDKEIYKIKTTSDENWTEPENVEKIVVVRAAVIGTDGVRKGPVKTNSYFIESVIGRTSTLPIVSIATDWENLFSTDSGIMVAGKLYNSDDPRYSGNYNQHGKDWERSVNAEFIEPGKVGLSQICGLRIHGDRTRLGVQKGLSLYAREEYGDKKFRYRFFKNLDIDKYKHLVLKPFMAAWSEAGLQDAVCNNIARHLNVDHMSSIPVMLYINGENWGIYYLQEKPDERWVENHNDIDAEIVDVVEDWNGTADNGNGDEFSYLMQWLQHADLRDSATFAYARQNIDIEEFIDYIAFEIFIANKDWPANNMRCWRHDGGWRWMFFDGDGAINDRDFDAFGNAIYEGDDTWPASKESTLMFRKLMENEQFAECFGKRFLSLIGNQLSYEQTGAILEVEKDKIADEIKIQADRFGWPKSKLRWTNAVGRVDKFLKNRETDARKEFEKLWGIEKNVVSNVMLFPNPTSTTTTITFESNADGWATMCAINELGQTVMQRDIYCTIGENKVVIDATMLPPGYYSIEIEKGAIGHLVIVQ